MSFEFELYLFQNVFEHLGNRYRHKQPHSLSEEVQVFSLHLYRRHQRRRRRRRRRRKKKKSMFLAPAAILLSMISATAASKEYPMDLVDSIKVGEKGGKSIVFTQTNSFFNSTYFGRCILRISNDRPNSQESVPELLGTNSTHRPHCNCE